MLIQSRLRLEQLKCSVPSLISLPSFAVKTAHAATRMVQCVICGSLKCPFPHRTPVLNLQRRSTEAAVVAIEESGSPFTFPVLKILRSYNAAYITFTKVWLTILIRTIFHTKLSL